MGESGEWVGGVVIVFVMDVMDVVDVVDGMTVPSDDHDPAMAARWPRS